MIIHGRIKQKMRRKIFFLIKIIDNIFLVWYTENEERKVLVLSEIEFLLMSTELS